MRFISFVFVFILFSVAAQSLWAQTSCENFADIYVCIEPGEPQRELSIEARPSTLVLDGHEMKWNQVATFPDSNELIDQTAIARCQGGRILIERRAKDIDSHRAITGELSWIEKFERTHEGVTLHTHGQLKPIGYPEQSFDEKIVCRKKTLHRLRRWLGLP